MLDVNATFLLTLRTPLSVDGKPYYKIWGPVDVVNVADIVFFKIGGFCNECYVSPEQVMFAVAVVDQPKDEDVAVFSDEFDDILDICL